VFGSPFRRGRGGKPLLWLNDFSDDARAIFFAKRFGKTTVVAAALYDFLRVGKRSRGKLLFFFGFTSAVQIAKKFASPRLQVGSRFFFLPLGVRQGLCRSRRWRSTLKKSRAERPLTRPPLNKWHFRAGEFDVRVAFRHKNTTCAMRDRRSVPSVSEQASLGATPARTCKLGPPKPICSPNCKKKNRGPVLTINSNGDLYF
jgi:hypothetical protein